MDDATVMPYLLSASARRVCGPGIVIRMAIRPGMRHCCSCRYSYRPRWLRVIVSVLLWNLLPVSGFIQVCPSSGGRSSISENGNWPTNSNIFNILCLIFILIHYKIKHTRKTYYIIMCKLLVYYHFIACENEKNSSNN